jgi:outer membrane lipoprotein SlyB
MEERAVADARVAGVGVMKNVQAAFLDTVSKDKGAVTLYSVAPGVMNTAMDAVKLAKQGLYDQTQGLQTQTSYALNAGKDMAQLPEALLLAINSTQDLGQYLNAVETLAVKTYGKTNEEITKILKPSATAGTQAEQMAKIQRDMFEASRKLNQATQQLVNDEMSFLANTIHKFAGTIGSLSDEVNAGNAGGINSMINTALGIVGIVGGISGFLNIKKELSLISNLSKAGTVPSGPGGSGAIAESIKPTSTIIDPSTGNPFAAAEKATLKATAAEGESVLSSLTKTANKIAKPLAGVGTALTVGLAVGEYADVEKARKQGKISAEEAKTKEGGIVGGAAGALGGAAIGAAIGTAIFPGIGTIIGGIAGGWLGEKEGTKIGESQATTDTTKAAAEEEARKKKQDEEKTKEDKVRTSEENLLEGVNRLNNTMDKILGVMRETAENTEKTAKEVNGNGWFQRKAH